MQYIIESIHRYRQPGHFVYGCTSGVHEETEETEELNLPRRGAAYLAGHPFLKVRWGGGPTTKRGHRRDAASRRPLTRCGGHPGRARLPRGSVLARRHLLHVVVW